MAPSRRLMLLPLPALRMLVAATLAAVAGCSEVRTDNGLETVAIRGESFHLEVSADNASRQLGLMHRTSLPDDGGMIFIFTDSAMRNFWMAYCVIDIDVIFLDSRGRVTATHRMTAQPPRREDETVLQYEARIRAVDYSSRFPAQFAIELKPGSLERLGVQVDEKIELDLPRLKATAR